MSSKVLPGFAFPAVAAIVAVGLLSGPARSRAAETSAPKAQPGSPDTSTRAGRQSFDLASLPSDSFVIKARSHSLPVVAKRGESVGSLAWRYLSESVYLRHGDLVEAIDRGNGLNGKAVKPGQTVLIPGIPDHPFHDKPVTVRNDFEARTIYLTGWTAGSDHGLDLIKRWKAAGGNSVVFDVKDFDGEIRIPYQHKYSTSVGVTIHNLPRYIHWLHGLHMHVIARIAVFRDASMAQAYPQLDVRSRKTGKPWLENGKLAWVDPSLPEVQQFNLDLANRVAADGADEIQFDYVRFPAEGDQPDALFSFEKQHPDWPRAKIITDFVARAYNELHPKGALVSLDVFGVMAWARKVDLDHTGQNITDLARHCDVISPMIYPSHFFHFDGYSDPGDAPEHFISESMRRFQEVTKGSGVVLRPWLQAFAWRTKSYSLAYVLTEMRVAAAGGGVGFLFWNADNSYPKPLVAMAEIHADGGRIPVGPAMHDEFAPATKTVRAPSAGRPGGT